MARSAASGGEVAERAVRRVRLAERATRPPATPVERLAVATLRREGALPIDRLVQQVASELYCEAVRNGAWIVDLGLFGSVLFVPDVARELEAGHGILWEIETGEGAR